MALAFSISSSLRPAPATLKANPCFRLDWPVRYPCGSGSDSSGPGATDRSGRYRNNFCRAARKNLFAWSRSTVSNQSTSLADCKTNNTNTKHQQTTTKQANSEMGIPGLLPLLSPITRPISLDRYRGLSAAVDAMTFLHRGIYAADIRDLRTLAHAQHGERYEREVMRRQGEDSGGGGRYQQQRGGEENGAAAGGAAAAVDAAEEGATAAGGGPSSRG